MREKALRKLAAWHASHPWRMLIVILLVTGFFAALAGRLTVTTHTSDLLPEGDPKVVQYNSIRDEFVTATSLVVVVQGEEKSIKAFADELAPLMLELRDSSRNAFYRQEIREIEEEIAKQETQKSREAAVERLRSRVRDLRGWIDKKMFQRVDYRVEEDFLRRHLLLLVKEEDLKNTKKIFMNPNLPELLDNLNDSMEREYVAQEDSLSTREKEDGAVAFLDGLEDLVLTLRSAVKEGRLPETAGREAADKLLIGDSYMLSYDKTALIMIAVPNFSIMDRDMIMAATESAQEVIDGLLRRYPNVRAGLTGPIAREHDEQVYASKSLNMSTFIALAVIFALLIVSFRMWVAPVFAIVTLVVGVIWAMGVARLAVGELNMITSMFSVVLLGLGIDFAVHMISGFTERRAAGDDILESLEKTFLKSGKGIITGALTTAFAFLSLIISRAPGMREMGIVAGSGMLAILLTTMLFLPVLLVLRERRIDRRRDAEREENRALRKDISLGFLGRAGEWLGRKFVFTIIAFLFVSIALAWSASQVSFDYDYMNIEPKGLASITLMDTILEKFDLSIEYALVAAGSVAESREYAEQYRELSSVGRTDDISLYLPSPLQQEKRIPHILEIRKQIASPEIRKSLGRDDLAVIKREIARLEMNVMEIQDMAFLGGQDKVDNKCKRITGDPENPESRNIIAGLLEMLSGDDPETQDGLSAFQRSFALYFKKGVVRMSSAEPIHLEDLPASVLDRYSNRARNQFLVSIFPAGDIWGGKEFLNRFVEDLERVSEDATGLPPLFIRLITIFGRDGRNAMLLTVFVVFFFLWLDFRNPRHALMAMIPLAFGLCWMIGLMHLFGMRFNVVNVIGLPLILGIGIDDGVHIMHRWRNEGGGKIRTVFASTGKAILLTSVTTMFAFGSLAFSIFRGFASFGLTLFIGVGACFLTTVLLMPGMLGLLETISAKKEKPKKPVLNEE